MKALAFLSKGKVGIIEKPMPECGPNDAVVRTTAALVCSSDVHTVRGVIELPPDRVLGHESVGVVEKVGAAVTAFKPGDRIAVNAITPCGRFVCNHVYHRLLVRAEGGALEALFVHLPPLAEETHGGLPLEDAERAVRLVLGCVAGYLGDPGASDRA
jgi:threonine dehydrogenase-like Zn-dependent dehydrogenase